MINANELFLTLGQTAAIALLGLLGALLFKRDFRPSWFVGALILYVLYAWLDTRGFFMLSILPADARWNWMGKSMSLIGMLAVAALPIFGFKNTGLTLRQNSGSWLAYIVFAAMCGLFFYLAISGAGGRDNWETIAFQWTMPGLDEEVFYRGVLLLAMNEAFRSRLSILGAPIGWGGLLTSVLFGLVHALSYGDGAFAFDEMTFLMTGVPSLILLWLREKTGSLVLPIIAHNVANGAFTIF